jgi:ATP-dependent helicase HrpA
VILQMKALRLGPMEDFPFLHPPNARLIADGYQTLLELGAVNKALELTPLGAKLARLPLDPRIARMILAGQAEGVEKEVLIIAAALSVQDPRERPLDRQEAADAAHAEFRDAHSDFLSYLKLWQWYHGEAKHVSAGRLRKACQGRFLSYTRLREWHDVQGQLQELLGEMRAEERPTPGRSRQVLSMSVRRSRTAAASRRCGSRTRRPVQSGDAPNSRPAAPEYRTLPTRP